MVLGDSISDNSIDLKLALRSSSDPFDTKFILCYLNIMVDMDFIAMCYNLMQEKIIKDVCSLGKRQASFKKQKNGSSGTNVTSLAEIADS